MKTGWAMGIKGLAIATALALAGPSIAQDAATAPIAGEAVVADTSAGLPDALSGYTRSKPTADIGQPIPRGISVPEQVTPIGREAGGMTNYLLNPVIIGISILVLVLMVYVVVAFRSSAREHASKTTHNFTIEVIWTLIPSLILLAIAFPSFRLLANQYNPPETDLTIKVTGHQWYWNYEYPDYGDLSFDSVMLSEDDAKANGEPYLLEVDNRLVVPAGKKVKVLVTGADVIHSFAVPSFWVKTDAIPGKINQTWFQVDRPGVYYGQCSEICGVRHGFMPIAVEVLPEEDFKRWVRMKQQQDGIELTGPGIAIEQPATAEAPAAEQQIETGAPTAAPAA